MLQPLVHLRTLLPPYLLLRGPDKYVLIHSFPAIFFITCGIDNTVYLIESNVAAMSCKDIV